MSDKIFDKVVFSDDFEISNDFMKDLLAYAIPHAVGDINSYWRSKDAEKIVSEKTFPYIWASFPDNREELLSVAILVASDPNTRVKSLSQEFCVSFVKDLYSLIDINEEKDDNRLRIRLLPFVDKSFDYLTELCKYSLDESKSDMFYMWRQAGMQSSINPSFYDYLWSKVKREPGSVDTKLSILTAASNNNALSDALIKKVAKSSPKRIKRNITEGLSGKITNEKRKIERLKRKCQELTLEDQALVGHYQKVVDEIEAKIMLFVDCTDREVVSNLLDCLSKENLPWLMPSASKHYYLSRRLQQMIDD